MSHDDENKNPDLNIWIDPELESRVIAWVLGEVSEFEVSELERLIEEKPELALFKKRIEAAHRLAGEAMGPEQEELRLSPERRAELLAKISAPVPVADVDSPIVYRKSLLVSWRKWLPAGVVSAAASFVLIFGIIRTGLRHSTLFDAEVGQVERQFSRSSKAPAAGSVYSIDESELGLGDVMHSPNAPTTEMDYYSNGRVASDTGEAMPSREAPDEQTAELRLRKMQTAATGPMAPSDEPIVDGFSMNQMGLVSESGAESGAGGYRYSNTGDRLHRQVGQDKRAERFGEDSSKSFKNEEVEKEENVYELRDLSRPDANKPAPPYLGSKLKRSGGGAGAPEPSARGMAKEADGEFAAQLSPFQTEDIVALSAFEVSKDDDISEVDQVFGDHASDRLEGARRENRDLLGTKSSSEAVDEKKGLVTVGGSVNGKLIAQSVISKARNVILPIEEVNAREEPVSTFSLHVSDVSFRLALAALGRGQMPDPEGVRAEEFYNAFDYGDPAPTTAEKISCRIDQAAHPIRQQRNLVRIAMKVPAIGRGAGQPLRLTVLLDTSGSMERQDRRESLQAAMGVLASLLGPDDRVTVIGFARKARLLEEAVPGDQAIRLVDTVTNTPSEGGTNLEQAIGLSVQLARRHFDPATQNRIVLITDGAANLGNADPDALAGMIETVRQQGIAFDACGVGTDGMNDAILEALTRKGDGRYYVLDRPEDADEGFADQLAGAFRPAAENVKVQVRFNPARVGNYRLIGFEKHRLRKEDFRNDAVDAAELAAEEAAVALYQVEVLPEGEGELGEVYVRFRDAATGEMVERSWTAPFDPYADAFDQASPAMQLAGTAAILAEVLRGGPEAEQVQLDELSPVVNRLRGHYSHEGRVQELVGMYEELRRIGATRLK